ncbi:MAG: ABC transporter substrate-binding protein [Lachnospiraceae bacterium]|nr:ABC transporter substrate-binding protein [Lachnospiraceae bacterium]
MKKRGMNVILAGTMAVSLAMGGTSMSVLAESGEKVTISVYLGGDSADENQAIIEAFNAQSNTIEAELVTLTEGSSGYEMLTVMYNAGNPPTVYFLEAGDVLKLTDKLMDLSDMECLSYAVEGTTDDVTADGAVYGVPANIQAYGMIYNRQILSEVMGEDFDPSTILTREDFAEVCDAIEEAGYTAVAISPFDWNLGNHWFTQIYAGQSEDTEEKDAFVAALEEGTADLENNEIFNDYMDTFDLLMEYNYYQDNPLETVADGNEKQAQLLATDQVAFWFHGNWATANIRTLDEEGEYGIMSVPVSESNPNYGKICTLVPGYFCVEQSTTTEEEQAAAQEFIDWLIMSEDGQEYVINCGNVPAYTNNEAVITESVSTSVVDYTQNGDNFPMYVMYPSDHYTYVGAAMQKYLDGQIDRSELAAEVSEYWEAQE